MKEGKDEKRKEGKREGKDEKGKKGRRRVLKWTACHPNARKK